MNALAHRTAGVQLPVATQTAWHTDVGAVHCRGGLELARA